jgi:hypothetical protein
MAEAANPLQSTGERPGQEAAPAIRRGTVRLLHALGFATVAELPLASGRRADLVAVGESGEIWIVEIKSCIADFRADRKWQEYRLYCDRLLFAVAPEFPVTSLPADAGLVIADAYGGTLTREAALHPLAPARRKSMLLRYGRAAAARLSARLDPGLGEVAV